MRKMMIAAAAALVTVSTAAVAQTAQIKVSRQLLLDGGLAGSSLTSSETAILNGTTSASANCALTHTHATAPTGVATSAAASGGTATVNNANVTLIASRTNPQGQAIGQATYGAAGGGFFIWAPTLGAANTDLGCPNEGSYQVELTPFIPSMLITAEQPGALISPETTTRVADTVCRDARKAFVDAHNSTPHTDPNDPNHKPNHNLGYAYETHCPDIVTVVPAVFGDPIPAVFSAEVPATFATHTYSYVLGAIAFGSTLTGTGSVDGVSFTF